MKRTFDDLNDQFEILSESNSNIYIDEPEDSMYDTKTVLSMCAVLAQTEEERDAVKKADNISSKLESLREELHKLKAKIKLISLVHSKDTSQTINELNGQRVVLEKKIELTNKKLVELEQTKAFNDVMLRFEKLKRTHKAEAIRKAKVEMREKSDDELRAVINEKCDYSETDQANSSFTDELESAQIRRNQAQGEIDRRETRAREYYEQPKNEPTKSDTKINQSTITKINDITEKLSKETVQFALKNPHVKNLTNKNSFAFVDTVIVMCMLIDINVISKFESSGLYSEYISKYHSNVIHTLSNSSLSGMTYAVVNNMFANRLSFWRSFLDEKTNANSITDELLLMIDYDLLNNEYFEWSGSEPLIVKDIMDAFSDKAEMMALLKDLSDESSRFEKITEKSLTAKKKRFNLRFHKFFIYFSLPLSILSMFGTLVSEWEDKKNVNLIRAGYTLEEAVFAENMISIEMFFIAAAIIFAICSILGLHKLKLTGYIAIYAYMISLLICRISVLSLYENLFPAESAQAWGGLISQIIFTVLVSIYYYKRRKIFVDGDTSYIKKKELVSEDSTDIKDLLISNISLIIILVLFFAIAILVAIFG